MLDNARRQLALVLLTVLGALLCTILLKPGFGMDLRGGNQLIYEVPDEVMTKLVKTEQTSVDAVMEHTVKIVRDRIDPTGVLDALVSRRGATGILIELPYRERAELDQIKARISSLGKLEMRIVAWEDWAEGDKEIDLAAEKQRLQNWLNTGGGKDLVLERYQNIDRYNDDPVAGPLASGAIRWLPHLIYPQVDAPSRWDRPFSQMTQTEDGVPPLANSTVAVFEPTDFNGGVVPEAKLNTADGSKPFLIEYVAVLTSVKHFTGEDLDPSGVQPGVAQDGRLAVHYRIRAEKTDEYADWTSKFLKKHSAIVLNGVIRSAPYFVSRIPGNGQISGAFTQSEVDELVKVLRTGSLQVEPQLLSDRSVGPTLGAYALWLGEISLIAGTLAVFAFMLWYYKLAGVVACVSLLLNVFLLWSAVLFMQATITLPGLGGIVLTLGMAVDANVLIYERIREEADRGKDMIRAVRAGFERAMSAILDSNITTFLTGLVLYNVGVGPVRGFAVTLMVGIVTTVFTQFFVTRLLFHYLLVKDKLKDFKVHRLFAQPKFDYLRHARKAFAFSAVLIVGGVGYALFAVPTEESLGIDFKGGANLQMVVKEATDAQVIRDRLLADKPFTDDFNYFAVNTIEAGADGKSTTFNLRLKLTDTMRERIENERQAWRAARKQAETDGKDPPPPYEAPYLVHMRRIFAPDLIKPAYSNPFMVESPDPGQMFAEIDIHLQRPVDLAVVREELRKDLASTATATVRDDPQATQGTDLFIEWKTGTNVLTSSLFDRVRTALEDVEDTTGHLVKLSDPFPEAELIEGRMVGELRVAAIGALILSWALIIFYLRVRFHEYKYGIAAVMALVHDVCVALAAVVFFNHIGLVHAEINLNMIACFLTIIGYSVNDTIVIFDRIRENVADQQRHGGHLTFRELINLSVNQTMSRTILTSGVTLFVVLAQFLVNWGTDSDLESFAFGMFVGMISGTYSTIFIAAPMLVFVADRAGQTPVPQAPATAPVTQ
ncbi:MAG: protein translocase subunit SecD [Planctomycetota bacterium]